MKYFREQKSPNRRWKEYFLKINSSLFDPLFLFCVDSLREQSREGEIFENRTPGTLETHRNNKKKKKKKRRRRRRRRRGRIRSRRRT